MKIAHILDGVWPDSVGGCEKFAFLLSEGTPDLLLGAYHFGRSHPYRLQQQILGAAPSDLDADLIHIHQIPPLGFSSLFALARQIPAVITLHDYYFICQRTHLLKADLSSCAGPSILGCSSCIKPQHWPLVLPYFALRQKLSRDLLSLMRLIFLPTKDLLKFLPSELHSKCRVLPYAVAEKTPPPAKRQNLCFAGRLRSHKGYQELPLYDGVEKIEVFAPREDLPLLPQGLQYMGPLGEYSLSQYEALILPSIWTETGPLIVLEALGQGTPVLAREGSLPSEIHTLPGIFTYRQIQGQGEGTLYSALQKSRKPINVPLDKGWPKLAEIRQTYRGLCQSLIKPN